MSKRHSLYWLGAVGAAVAILSANTTAAARPSDASPTASHDGMNAANAAISFAHIPLHFELNEGQAPSEVRYLAHGSDYALLLAAKATVLRSRAAKSGEAHSVGMRFVGASESPVLSGDSPLSGKCNYIIGNNPSLWKQNIPLFGAVHYSSVYPGIDLRYYGSAGRIEHDFIVSPGGSPDNIRLAFEDQDSASHPPLPVRIDRTGNLLVGTAGFQVKLTKPDIYQGPSSNRHHVDGHYQILSSGEIGFQVARYDHHRALIIDPLLIFDTYLGGSGADAAYGVAVGTDGTNYIVGSTTSRDFGGITRNPNGQDAFVAKVAADGSAIQYLTYIGGSGSDVANSVAVDGQGNAYTTGVTASSDFPTTTGAFQPLLNGTQDAFVAKLDSNGNVVYSTLYGGSLVTMGSSIAVDNSQTATFVGSTTCIDLPTSTGCYQAGSPGGWHAFAARMNSTGSALVYGTYIEGNGADYANGLALAPSGTAYVCGTTSSTNLPYINGVQGAFFPTAATNGYVVAVTPNGSALTYSTYLLGTDSAKGIALDVNNRLYITGGTTQTNLPPVGLQILATLQGGEDAYLYRINPAVPGPPGIDYTTYIGGTENDEGESVAVDGYERAHVTGFTYSPDFLANMTDGGQANTPIQLNGVAIPFSTTGTQKNAFICRFRENGNAFPLAYWSYLGGGDAEGTAVALDNLGEDSVVGWTTSNAMPTYAALQPNLAGSENCFLAKILDHPFHPINIVATASGANTVVLDWTFLDNSQTYIDIDRYTGADITAGLSGLTYTPLPVPAGFPTINNGTTTSYTDNPPGVGSTSPPPYTYRIQDGNAAGNSGAEYGAVIVPAPVTNLAATAASQTEIDLSWNADPIATGGYEVYRKIGNNPATELANITGSPAANAYQDTGLSPNTQYSYTIVSVATNSLNGTGSIGYGFPTGTISISTLPYPPAAPTLLTAQAVSETEIQLTWSAPAASPTNGAPTAYYIQRLVGGGYSTIAVVSASAPLIYTDTDLNKSTKYTYQIVAVNLTTNPPLMGGISNQLSATTFPSPPIPVNTLIVTSFTTTTANLSWVNPPGNNATEFIINRSVVNPIWDITGAATSGTITMAVLVNAGAAQTTATALPATAAALAIQTALQALSNVGTGNVIVTGGPLGTAPVIVNFVGGLASQAVSLTVNATQAVGGTVAVTPGAQAQLAQVATQPATTTTFGDVNLTPGDTYEYQVVAENNGGESTNNPTVDVTLPLQPPAAPQNLVATPIGTTEIDLTWTPGDTSQTGFTLFRSTGTGAFVQIATLPATAVSYADIGQDLTPPGLAPDQLYTYYLIATNLGGNSPATPNVTATTFPNIPAPPTGLTLANAGAPNGQTEIIVTWSDTTGDATSYTIYRQTGSLAFQPITAAVNISPSPLSYTDTGLTANTVYSYEVVANNLGGSSAPSPQAALATLPNPPGTPSGFTATAVSSTQINLAWSYTAGDATGYNIYRQTGAAPAALYQTINSGTATSYSDTGLLPNTQYTYSVQAFNLGGNGPDSATQSATTEMQSPNPATGAAAAAAAAPLGQSQINITWTASVVDSTHDAATGYLLQRSADNGVTWTSLNPTAPIAASPYTDTGLAPSTLYSYQVQAVNNGGSSTWSVPVATAQTLPATPAAPGNVAASPAAVNGQTSITITWTDPGDATSFTIERLDPATGTYVAVAGTTAQPNPVPASVSPYAFTDTSLTANTSYTYEIVATNAGGSENSAPVTTSTLPDVPAAVTTLTATALSPSQVTVAWTDTNNDFAGFVLQRQIGSSTPVTIADLPGLGSPFTAGQTSFTFQDNGPDLTPPGLLPNTTYSYQVYATNTGGTSAVSNLVSVTTPLVAPAPPTLTSAVAVSTDQVNLAWTDTNSDFSSFVIQREDPGSTTFNTISTLTVAAGTSFNFSDNTGLSADQTYTYQILAVNSGGSSVPSNTVQATTLPNPPLSPIGLTVTGTTLNTVTLQWTDSHNDATGFQILRGVPGQPLVLVAPPPALGAAVRTYTDPNLVPGTSYAYEVVAVNTGGTSSPSSQVIATTLPTPPGSPTITKITVASSTEIDFTWTFTGTAASFQVVREIGSGAFLPGPVVLGSARSIKDTGLTPNTIYTYQVFALNAGGSSPGSNMASSTTLPNGPLAPSGLTATTVSANQINVAWTLNNTNVTAIELIRQIGGGSYNIIATLPPSATSYQDQGQDLTPPGLSPGVIYTYQVISLNGGGTASSNLASATTLPSAPPAPVITNAFAVSASQINLVWQPGSATATSYTIWRQQGTNTPVDVITVYGITSFPDTGLATNTTYSYWVFANNVGGTSASSNRFSATTQPNPPASPANLTATTTPPPTGQSQINLAWTDTNNDFSGFEIFRELGSGQFTLIATVPANTFQYSDTALLAGTIYTYQVFATNLGGLSSTGSNLCSATTLPATPTTPVLASVTPQSQTEITITWNDTALDFVGFTLIRQAGAGSYTSFALPTPIQGATSFSYTDTGLTANTIYTYQIVANNLGGNSAPSNAISATTLPNPPLAPVNLTAVAVSNTLVNLYWQPGSGNELGFQIERVTTGGAFQQVGQTGPGFTAASDTVPTGGTLYTYRIRSFNAGGESPYSNSAQVTTLPDPPVAPTNLEASPQSSTAIALSWTTNSTTQTGFQIDRAIGDGPFSVLATPLGTASGYVDSYDLTAGTSVSYEILAFNGTGTSAFSPTVTVVTLQTPATVPAAPGNLTAAPLSQTQVSLGWTPNSTNATGYEVQRLNGTGGWELLTPKPITTTTYTDTTAFANTTFTYEVIAIDAVGNSQPSPTVQVTTRPNPPAAPSSVTATAQSSTSVIVTWVSNSPNATFFFIQRASTAPGSTFQTVGQPPANAGTTFVDQTAAAGTTYIYRVLAQNTGGTSGPSNQVTVTTP